MGQPVTGQGFLLNEPVQVAVHDLAQQGEELLPEALVISGELAVEPVIVHDPGEHVGVFVAVVAAHVLGKAGAYRGTVLPVLGGVFEQVGAVFVDVVGQGLAQREAVGGEVGPVLKLDVEIPPNHGPEGVVIPRPHEVEDGAVLTHGGAKLVHLDPVEGFFFRVIEGDEALRVVVTPPLVVGGEEGVGSEVLLGFFDVCSGYFEAVFFREGVMHGGEQSLFCTGISVDVPAGGGFATVLVEELFAVIDLFNLTQNGLRGHGVRSFSECFPARRSASSIEGSAGG